MVRCSRKRGGNGSKNKKLLPNPFPEGVNWGNFLLNENKKGEYKNKGKANREKGKQARNRTRKNYLEKHCADVLKELIDGVSVRDALKGCEIAHCKNWHIGEAKKKGQEECRSSVLKTKALNILKEKCPEYLKRGGSIEVNDDDPCDAIINYVNNSELIPINKYILLQHISNELRMDQLNLNRMLNGIEVNDNFIDTLQELFNRIPQQSKLACSDKIANHALA